MIFNIKKEDACKSGIYKILNLKNSKYYVGSTKCFVKRYYRHKHDLKSNTHSNRKLQSSYNKHGWQNFSFELIEICEEEDLLNKEQYFIDNGVCLYNLSEAYRPIGMTDKHHTDETKYKISKSLKAISGKNPYMLGKRHSVETIKKISDSQLGSKNHYFGRKVDEQVKAKISESNKGIRNHQYISDVFAENIKTKEVIRAHTASELSKILGVAESTVGLRLNENNQRATSSLINKVWRIYRK